MKIPILVRRGEERDLAQVAAIQESSPEAAQWKVADYLGYEMRVAMAGAEVVGFLVARGLDVDEREILNLAVLPGFRRAGVAGELVQSFLAESTGVVYLEVRESNLAARNLYKSMGFQEVSVRQKYYTAACGSPESAIVMKFHSC